MSSRQPPGHSAVLVAFESAVPLSPGVLVALQEVADGVVGIESVTRGLDGHSGEMTVLAQSEEHAAATADLWVRLVNSKDRVKAAIARSAPDSTAQLDKSSSLLTQFADDNVPGIRIIGIVSPSDAEETSEPPPQARLADQELLDVRAHTIEEEQAKILGAITLRRERMEQLAAEIDKLAQRGIALATPWAKLGRAAGITGEAARRRWDASARQKHRDYYRRSKNQAEDAGGSASED